MWTQYRRQAGVLLIIAMVLSGIAGCAPAPQPAQEKPAAVKHGMVKMQQLLEAHPQQEKLRQLEQSVAAAEEQSRRPSAEAMNEAKLEFDAAMEVRRNQDLQTIDKKEAQLKEKLNDERRVFLERLEAEYRPQLVNLDLKLATLQYAPAEKQKVQQERDRVEAERQGKIAAKDAELAAVFKKESSNFVDELSRSSKAYADQWMNERMSRMQKEAAASAALPAAETQRKEMLELSGRVMRDIKQAVTVVAEREKIDMVWVYPVVRQQATDITDAVVRELKK